MKRRGNRLKLIIIVIVSLLSVWYFLIKKHDYIYVFTAQAIPGVVYQNITSWSRFYSKNKDSITDLNRVPFQKIVQKWEIGHKQYEVSWYLELKNDSTTKVMLGINTPKNSLKNRFDVVVGKNHIKENTQSLLLDYKKSLDYFLTRTKVEQEVVYSDTPENFCAYLTLECKIEEKATKMIANNFIIPLFLSEHNISVKGKPFIEILKWDVDNSKIQFNLCVPIDKREELPIHSEIKFKENKKRKALKATYYGNYRTSDRAWYELYNYAKENKISIEETPLEYFYNSPMLDGDELEWKAEIFVPLNNSL